MLDKLSQREKILLIAALILIICAAYYFYFYKPLNAEINSLAVEKELQENKLKADRKLIQKLPELRSEYNNLLVDYNKLLASYEDKSIIDLLIDLREITRENNIKLVRYQPIENDEQITINLTLNGDYLNLSYLFRDFETWSSWFEFSDLRLTGQGEMLNVSMALIYHKMQE